MRYFINCNYCSKKFYVAANALTRSELPHNFNLTCPSCRKILSYVSYDVNAETSILGSQGLAVLGGLIGLAAGGVGALIGAGLGAAIGKTSADKDKQDVERFNSS